MQNSAIYRLFDIHTNDIIIQMLDIPIWLNYFCKLYFLFYSNKTKPQDIFLFSSCEQKTYVEISHSVSMKHKNMISDGWLILTFSLLLGKPCQKNHGIWSNFLIAHWIDSHNGGTKNRIYCCNKHQDKIWKIERNFLMARMQRLWDWKNLYWSAVPKGQVCT